jgi:hypothetical protein
LALLGRLAQPQFITRRRSRPRANARVRRRSDRRISLYTLTGIGVAALVAYLLMRSRQLSR